MQEQSIAVSIAVPAGSVEQALVPLHHSTSGEHFHWHVRDVVG